MNNFERLEDYADNKGIEVIENCPMKGKRVKGLYNDNIIALSDKLKTTTEKACVLAEEIGHYKRTSGNIIDMSKTENRKQEHKARLWGYNKLIGLRGLIDAFNSGCRSQYEMADYLNVTEEFLKEALETYRDIYGLYKVVDNYTVYFIPKFGVGKIF